jgi:prepilin-type N-terminal cleavage/methylation domain-containing protein
MTHNRLKTPAATADRKQFAAAGFSLIELMIAMTVFLVIAGATLSLFRQNTSTFNSQQNMAAMNISLRSALTQMEMDVVNAGTGFYNTASISSFPVGMTIQNVAGGSDTLNIVSPDTTVPPSHPDDGTPTHCPSTTATSLNLVPIPASGLTPGMFSTGDELLLMTGATTLSGRNQMTTVVLTGAGAAGPAGAVTVNHTATDGLGQNPADKWNLTTNTDTSIGELGTTFCQATDWVIKLSPPIQYLVNGTNQLVRTQGATTDVIADNVVAFKVGATTYTGGTSGTYNYGVPAYKYDEIRSVRITLTGSTPPNPSDPFRNTFNGQPYRISSLSVVVNPRNLSMN